MEEINEWQQIEQHPSLESSEWNRVVINENSIEVQDDQSTSIYDPLTPTHHEGSLQMVTSPTTIDPEEDGTSSSSVSDEAGETPTPAAAPLDWANEGKKLLKLRFEAMRAEVVKVASKVRISAIRAGAFWSITYVAGAAAATAVLVSLVSVAIRRRRRKVDRLDYLLRQKDEKISQLLLQIAYLNEALSSRRKVLVHQIGR